MRLHPRVISWLWPLLPQGSRGEEGVTPLYCPLHVAALDEGTQSRGPPLPPFPGKGSRGHAGLRRVWLRFPAADLPALSPLRLTPAKAVPLCQQQGGKPQHEKHLVAPTRHVGAGLPPHCCSQPGQILAAAANIAEHPPGPSWLPASRPRPASAGSGHHVSNTLSGELPGVWEGKHHTNPILMERAAMSFPLRLFLNCLSKACCSWQRGGGLFLDACFTSPQRWAGIGSSFLLPGTLRRPAGSAVCPAKVTAVCLLTCRGTF